jgi:hypothetical protein
MGRKIRKQIYLDERQDRLLKRQARLQGVSEAELIRRAVDSVVPRSARGGTNPGALDVLLCIARSRAAQGQLPGQRDWRREDLYEDRLARRGN